MGAKIQKFMDGLRKRVGDGEFYKGYEIREENGKIYFYKNEIEVGSGDDLNSVKKEIDGLSKDSKSEDEELSFTSFYEWRKECIKRGLKVVGDDENGEVVYYAEKNGNRVGFFRKKTNKGLLEI